MLVFIAALAVGLLVWTLLEYAIHYWLGHLSKGRIFVSREHLHHHADILYETPLAIKATSAVPLFAFSLLGVGTQVGVGAGFGFVAGVALGWGGYEWLHREIHRRGPVGWYSRWACRHHFHHHFNSPGTNHGVTCPLWDLVFGTYQRVEGVRVPARSVPSIPWLEGAFADGVEPSGRLADYRVV